MEAAPRLSTLSIECKFSPENTEFVAMLRTLIRGMYNEEPDSFTKEIDEMAALRSQACIRPSRDMAGLNAAKRYYSQLHFLKNRFRIRGVTDDGPFSYPWYDNFTGMLSTHKDFDYEMAAALYNVGALHTKLGTAEDRTGSEGMKIACTHFQCAAWAFHTLPDRYLKKGNFAGTDLLPEVLAFFSQVCLAQAQECILEKSILDHRKPGIIVKVGMQVVMYYMAARKKVETSNDKVDTQYNTQIEIADTDTNKGWLRYVEFKVHFYTAVTEYYMGVEAEEAGKIGEAVSCLAEASKTLALAASKAKKLKGAVIEKKLLADCLVFAGDVVNGKLESARKDNEFIYHERVPEFESLPEPKAASLVKGIAFDVADADVSGRDIFARLVPIEAHEASSMYSEEKAKLLRGVGANVDEKDAELAVFMSSLRLDEVPAPGDNIAMPQELIECAAGLSVKEDAVRKLTDAMARIAAVSADVEVSLAEIADVIENEEEQLKEYETIVGKRPTPLNSELKSEYEKYKDAHTMASGSNATLHKAMQLHMGNLKLLSKPLDELQAQVPSMADLDEDSEASIAEVQRIVKKVDEMKRQRAQITEQFREGVHADDITKKLVLHKDKKLPEIFSIELKKHDGLKKIIDQNLVAQANILQALTEMNARYATTRRTVSELLGARNEMISSLTASYHAYDDLLTKAAKGLEFYDKLDSNVTKLLARVNGVVKVQQEERDAILAQHAPPMPASNYLPGGAPIVIRPPSSDVNASSGSSSGRPTLKDYLKSMKETNSTPSMVYAAMNNLPPKLDDGPGPRQVSQQPSGAYPPAVGHFQPHFDGVQPVPSSGHPTPIATAIIPSRTSTPQPATVGQHGPSQTINMNPGQQSQIPALGATTLGQQIPTPANSHLNAAGTHATSAGQPTPVSHQVGVGYSMPTTGHQSTGPVINPIGHQNMTMAPHAGQHYQTPTLPSHYNPAATQHGILASGQPLAQPTSSHPTALAGQNDKLALGPTMMTTGPVQHGLDQSVAPAFQPNNNFPMSAASPQRAIPMHQNAQAGPPPTSYTSSAGVYNHPPSSAVAGYPMIGQQATTAGGYYPQPPTGGTNVHQARQLHPPGSATAGMPGQGLPHSRPNSAITGASPHGYPSMAVPPPSAVGAGQVAYGIPASRSAMAAHQSPMGQYASVPTNHAANGHTSQAMANTTGANPYQASPAAPIPINNGSSTYPYHSYNYAARASQPGSSASASQAYSHAPVQPAAVGQQHPSAVRMTYPGMAAPQAPAPMPAGYGQQQMELWPVVPQPGTFANNSPMSVVQPQAANPGPAVKVKASLDDLLDEVGDTAMLPDVLQPHVVKLDEAKK